MSTHTTDVFDERLDIGDAFHARETGNTQVLHHHDAAEGSKAFNLLIKNAVNTALYDSNENANAPRCYPGTRVAILAKIQDWVTISATNPIMWIHGSAGTGKSTIMQTLAESFAARGLPLASFFPSNSDLLHNSSQRIIPTLACQISLAIPLTRPHIEKAIEDNPAIFSLTITDQAQALIVEPLHIACSDADFDRRHTPLVILIDSLDECGDATQQSEFLRSLVVMVTGLPIAVIVASRPKGYIRSTFDLGNLNQTSSQIALDDSFDPDMDIRKYFVDKFYDIQSTHPLRSLIPAGWPPSETIDTLVEKAAGQFAFAFTLIQFCSSVQQNPVTGLEIILGDRGATGPQPHQELDCLYSTILCNIDTGDLPMALELLGIVLTPAYSGELDQTIPTSYRSPSFLDNLLGLEKGATRRLLHGLESITIITDDRTDVGIYHRSLSDFLFDKSRAGGFFVDKDTIFAQLAIHTISHGYFFPCDIGFIEHFSLNLPFYMLNAGPDSGLKEFLDQLDIRTLIDCRNVLPGSKYPAYGVRLLAPAFLYAIKILRMPGAEDLYKAHLQQFTMIVNHSLHVYLKSLPLQYLTIAVLTLSPSSDWLFEEFFEALSLPISTETIEWDRSAGLHLYDHGCYNFAISSMPDPTIFQLSKDCDGNPLIQDCCTNFAVHLITSASQMEPEKHPQKQCSLIACREPSPKHSFTTMFDALLPPILKRSILRSDLLQLVNKAPQIIDHTYLTVGILLALTSYRRRWGDEASNSRIEEGIDKEEMRRIEEEEKRRVKNEQMHRTREELQQAKEETQRMREEASRTMEEFERAKDKARRTKEEAQKTKEEAQKMQENLVNLEEQARLEFRRSMQAWTLLGIVISVSYLYIRRPTTNQPPL